MRTETSSKAMKIIRLVLAVICVSAFYNVRIVSAQTPVVHAILFFSPSCGHCHKVITEDLPPLIEQYQDNLVIIGINIQNEEGGELFLAAVEAYDFPKDRAGVPFLVVGEIALMGSVDIPEKFPGIIEEELAAGGTDWPQIPGLIDYLQANNLVDDQGNPPEDILPAQDVQLTENTPDEDLQPQDEPPKEIPPDISLENDEIVPLTMKQRFLQDVVANSISVLILIGMAVVVFWVVMIVAGRWKERKPCQIRVILLVVLIGMAVSVYLSFVELTEGPAVCGPIGDCNTVQQSEYAYLFGRIPIGILGIVGYGLVLVMWIFVRWGPEKFQKCASEVLFGMTLGGTLFSIYLTFLEPFVIGASCAWCLTSAITMTGLMWCATQEMISIKNDYSINSL